MLPCEYRLAIVKLEEIVAPSWGDELELLTVLRNGAVKNQAIARGPYAQADVVGSASCDGDGAGDLLSCLH